MTQYICHYSSPFGKILLEEDEKGLCGLWFEDSVLCPIDHDRYNEKYTDVLIAASKWLDIYFKGKEPGFMPPLHIVGTDFQKLVWSLLFEIPYGKTVSYGELASQIATEKGIRKMSAQAVGGAVGSNRISIVIPCHRVIGVGGKLIGYGGGMWRKKSLLDLEGSINDNK